MTSRITTRNKFLTPKHQVNLENLFKPILISSNSATLTKQGVESGRRESSEKAERKQRERREQAERKGKGERAKERGQQMPTYI
jgi:hypothetical protein